MDLSQEEQNRFLSKVKRDRDLLRFLIQQNEEKSEEEKKKK